MDYDALKLFVHLSQTLHFGRTSRACHISPSALSRLVQRLEQIVDAPLFERDKRQVKLTPEGQRFAQHARDTLERWRAFQDNVRGHQARLSGSISIFATVTACQSFLPRVLSAFRQAYPDIHIQLETGYAAEALDRVQSDAVDVTVAAIPDRVPPGLATRVLLHTPLVFVAPASPCDVTRLMERDPIPWADVPLVLPTTGLARSSVDRWLRRKRVTPRIYGELSGNEAILSLVSLGCGVGVVPKLVADKSPLRGDVRLLDVEPPVGEFRVGVCAHRRRLRSPLVRAFWDSLAAA